MIAVATAARSQLSSHPGPTPTSGPCNENVSSWTDDFGDNDWTAQYWNLPSFSDDSPPGDPFAGTPVATKTLSKIDGFFGTNSPESGVVNPESGKPRSLIYVSTPGEKLEKPYPKKGHRGTRYYDGAGWGNS